MLAGGADFAPWYCSNEASTLCVGRWCVAARRGWPLTAGWQKRLVGCENRLLAIANKFEAMIDSGNIPPQYTRIATRAVGDQ